MEPDPEGRTHRDHRRGRPRDRASQVAILAATRDLLVEMGYQRLSLERVARRAGVGKATIYRWWDSKLDLVLEAAAPHLEIGLVPDTGTTRGDLVAAIHQVIGTYADPIAAIVIFAVIADLEADTRLRDEFRATWVAPWRQSLVEALRRGIGRGELPADVDLSLLVDLLVGTVFQRVLIVPEPMSAGLADDLVQLVLHGRLPTSKGG